MDPASRRLPVKMTLKTNVSTLPSSLQLTALAMDRGWESRARMSIGCPPALVRARRHKKRLLFGHIRAAFGRIESAAAFQSGGDLIQGKGWQGRPAYMPKALSFDLRSRVLAAIDEGLSCRQAATRFGVSASSAIRWQGMRREGGDARPKPQGGDRLSRRTEAHAELIHAALAEVPDITLPELKARLAEKGAQVSVSALWRFCRRHRITRKKRRHMPPSRTGRIF